MKNNLLIHFLLIWSFFSCDFSPKPKIAPERVVVKYQELIDKNNFKGAKVLSTKNGQAFIDELAASIPKELIDSTIIHTKFLKIDCKIEDDIANCLCEVEDEYERYEALYSLLLVKGRWLVDAPEEEPMDFEEIEDIVEDILDMGITN